MSNIDIDYNALGQAMDTTWGRSSTPMTTAYSVKFNLHGNNMIVTCGMGVNFGTEKEMILTKRACSAESEALINEVLKKIKTTYKDISGKSLTTKQTSTNESLEIIGFGIHNPKRTARYLKKIIFEIG